MSNFKKRAISFILAFILILGIMLSYLFVANNLHHDCQGESCAVCMEIERAVQFTSRARLIPTNPFILFVIIGCLMSLKSSDSDMAHGLSPVTLKVRLLN